MTDQIDLKKHIAKGTGLHTTIGYLVTFFVLGVLTIVTMGAILILVLVGLLFAYFRDRKAMAHLNGSTLKVGPDQFPEI